MGNIEQSPSTDRLAYSGAVKLQVIRNAKTILSKTITNMGTLDLFKGVALALNGTPSNNLLPNFIGIGSNASPTTIEQTALNGEITRRWVSRRLVSRTSDGQGYVSTLTTTIPSNLINGKQIQEVGLYGNETENTLLARIILEGEDILSLSVKDSLTIEWQLTFTNKTESKGA